MPNKLFDNPSTVHHEGILLHAHNHHGVLEMGEHAAYLYVQEYPFSMETICWWLGAIISTSLES
jgi:hypothetical protein